MGFKSKQFNLFKNLDTYDSMKAVVEGFLDRKHNCTIYVFNNADDYDQLALSGHSV